MKKGLKKGFLRRMRPVGQTAIEYLLLLSAVVVVVLLAFPRLIPRYTQASNRYFNKVSYGILGDSPRRHLQNVDGTMLNFYKARTDRFNYP